MEVQQKFDRSIVLLHKIFKYPLIKHIVGLELDQTVARLETGTIRKYGL